ncbi:MAG: DUF1559 domain-containing protein [Planctomycetia bacterium]|nr:DUF1559 domain-containing protein [Planctomycetia bacterium]
MLVIFAIISLLIALLLPAVQRSSSGGRREQCKNNLKQLGLALHAYHEKYGSFPPAYFVDAHGNPAHSWRVLILPFIDQQDLYDQYRFDEPWNGPNNSRLAEKIVPLFNCPGARDKAIPRSTMTSYVAVIGPATAWPGERSARLDEIDDGSSETLLLVEAANSGIHWMEPRDLSVLQMVQTINAKSGQGISSVHIGGAHVLLCDGAVRFMTENLSADSVRALLTRSAGDSPGEF